MRERYLKRKARFSASLPAVWGFRHTGLLTVIWSKAKLVPWHNIGGLDPGASRLIEGNALVDLLRVMAGSMVNNQEMNMFNQTFQPAHHPLQPAHSETEQSGPWDPV